ncbi:hypothetical protein DMI72_01430 [Akkermansia muciniphila]|nr:hypothetical protein DMI72_01430 [Akkermansia muciniphila]
MNSAASFSTPPEEEGPCGDWTYHEWSEAFSTNDLARALPRGILPSAAFRQEAAAGSTANG